MLNQIALHHDFLKMYMFLKTISKYFKVSKISYEYEDGMQKKSIWSIVKQILDRVKLVK